MKFFLLISLLLNLNLQDVENFERRFDTSFIQVGEELVYEVKYLFFKLGKITFKVVDKFKKDDKEFFKVRIKIDSYSVPFVYIHANFEAIFDSRFVAVRVYGEQEERKYFQTVKYELREDLKAYIMEKNYINLEYNTEGRKVDTIKIGTMYCDGPSLFYYARANADKKRTVLLPTFIDGIKGTTVINFNKKKTSLKIDAVDYPVEAYELDGKVDYVGFFGLTGDFVGWVSSDRFAVPLKGKLKVIVGSVVVELKKWNSGWSPPQVKN